MTRGVKLQRVISGCGIIVSSGVRKERPIPAGGIVGACRVAVESIYPAGGVELATRIKFQSLRTNRGILPTRVTVGECEVPDCGIVETAVEGKCALAEAGAGLS